MADRARRRFRHKVTYDVHDVRTAKRLKKSDKPPEDRELPDGYAGQFLAREVQLHELVIHGVPAHEFHAFSEGMLIRGKRHQWFAPAKEGKSLVALNHAVRMALAGEVVVILDKENGSHEYARRLQDITEFLKVNPSDLAGHLRYFEYPPITGEAGEFLSGEFDRADLIIFDSQRTILSDLGLQEDKADDFSKFVSQVLMPLSEAGISTLMLDNTGHSERLHSRGSSAKGDLLEIIFSLTTEAAFDMFQRGRVKLDVTMTRFGNRGAWSMEIGNGFFGDWEPVGPTLAVGEAIGSRPDTDRVMDVIPMNGQGLSGKAIEVRLARSGVGSRRVRKALETLVSDGRLEDQGSGGKSSGKGHLFVRAGASDG